MVKIKDAMNLTLSQIVWGIIKVLVRPICFSYKLSIKTQDKNKNIFMTLSEVYRYDSVLQLLSVSQSHH